MNGKRLRRPVTTLLVTLFAASVSAQDGNPGGAVAALGRIEPEHGIIRVAAPSTPESISGAILAQLLVDEGDSVESGQLLAETDATAAMAAGVVEAERELELAEEDARAMASVAEAECVQAETARSEAERRRQLLDKGLAAEEEVEQAQGDARSLAAACVSAQARASAAGSAIGVARARLVRSQAEYERSRIYAPTDGLVLRVNARPGEFILHDGILELGAVEKMYAVAEVYETDIRRVRVGQRATVTSDALPGPITGSVEFIQPKVQKHDEIGTDPAARKDARIIEVDILLDQPESVRALINLQVEIVIGQ